MEEQSIAKLGEFGFISRLTSSVKNGDGVITGIGDDGIDGDDSGKGAHIGVPLQIAIEAAAQAVLDTRTKYLTPLNPPLSGGTSETHISLSSHVKGRSGGVCTLADLYDPLTMPPDLVKAHQTLDKVVDKAYGRTNFTTEAERVAFLFERYQQLVAPLVVVDKPGKNVRMKGADRGDQYKS